MNIEAEKISDDNKGPKIIDITPEGIRKRQAELQGDNEPASAEEMEKVISSFVKGQEIFIDNLEETLKRLEENATQEEKSTLRQALADAKHQVGKVVIGAKAFVQGLPGGKFIYGLAKAGYTISSMPGRIAMYPVKKGYKYMKKASGEASEAMKEYDEEKQEAVETDTSTEDEKEPPAMAAKL